MSNSGDAIAVPLDILHASAVMNAVRPHTAAPDSLMYSSVDRTSNTSEKSSTIRPLTAAPTGVSSNKADDSKGQETNYIRHRLPRYDVYGQLIPPGKGAGLRMAVNHGASTPLLPDTQIQGSKFPSHWKSTRALKPETNPKRGSKIGQIDWSKIDRLKNSNEIGRCLTQAPSKSTRTRSQILHERRQGNLLEMEANRQRFEHNFSKGVESLFYDLAVSKEDPRSESPEHDDSQIASISTRARTGWAPKYGAKSKACVVSIRNNPQQSTAKHHFKTRKAMIKSRKKEDRRVSDLAQTSASFVFSSRKALDRPSPITEDPVETEPTLDGPVYTRSQLNFRRRKEQHESLDRAQRQNQELRNHDAEAILGLSTLQDEPWWQQQQQHARRPSTSSTVFRHPKEGDQSMPELGEDGPIKGEQQRRPLSASAAGDQRQPRSLFEARVKRKTVAGKIPQRDAGEVSSGFGPREATRRFTTAILELNIEKTELELDENGKCKLPKPCENDPLFSSFTSDRIFIDPLKRKRLENMINVQLSREPFVKLFPVDAASSRPVNGSISGNAPGQTLGRGRESNGALTFGISRFGKSAKPDWYTPPEISRKTKRVGLDKRRQIAIISEPRQAGLLTNAPLKSNQDEASGTVGLSLGVRTGGFRFEFEAVSVSLGRGLGGGVSEATG